MAYHNFRAISLPECPVLAEGSEVLFRKYFGIGTFPLKSTDKLYHDEIIASLNECEIQPLPKVENENEGEEESPDAPTVALVSQQGTCCYMSEELTKDEVIEQIQAAWAQEQQLFEVIDETVAKEEEKKKILSKKQEKDLRPTDRHSAYYYIFVRPVQIILILLAIGYLLMLAYRRELKQRQIEEAIELEQMMRGEGGFFDDEE